jgi:hypothetical protein
MKDRKGFLAVLLGLLLVFPALSFSQEVVYFFAAPGANGTWGLTWDGSQLWSASVAPGSNVIYELDTLGNIMSSFNWAKGNVSGMVWDGAGLWLCENFTGNLYQVSKTGVLLQQFSTSLGDVAGLTWDGTNLWVIDRVAQTINKLDASGNVIVSFSTPTLGGDPDGLTWDGSAFWFCDPYYNKIFQLSSTGTVLQEFSGPGLGATELEWDGRYLWVSDIVTDRIYKLKVTPAEQLVDARIEFPGGHWPVAWREADRKPNCDTTVEIDDEDMLYWNSPTSKEYQEKLTCRRKVNCFIGDLRLGNQTFDVGDIIIESIRANDTIPVMAKKKCDEEMNLSAGLGSPAPQSCFDIKYYHHLDRFQGRVLRVRFDATQIFKTIDWAGAGDTVEICVSGKLANGMRFQGCTEIVIVGDNPTDVSQGDAPTPQRFALLGNYPNPFNATTLVKFQLTRPSLVELNVYNILGQKVKTLVKEQMTSGSKQIIWDGTDENGRQLATGIYFYRLVTVEGRQTGKMTMLK